MLYTLRFFFSSKCSLFHNANLFGSCIIHILYTECAKIKRKKSFRRQRVKAYEAFNNTFEVLLTSAKPAFSVHIYKTVWTLNLTKAP